MEYLVMLPGPTNVPNRVMNAMLAPVINHRSEDFRTLYKSIIEKTQKLFQTQSDVVLLSSSGTGAVESSVVNLVKKGDKVVIPVNGEFSTRLADLIDSWGGNSIRIESPYGENPPYEKFEEVFDEHKDIKALYAVYNETSTGTTIRYMDKLGDLCSKNNSFFIADSVSILGGDELPVDKWNIDLCVTASQKAIAAPPGVSPISVSARAKKYIQENPAPILYFNLKRYFKYYEEHFETPFTPALPLVYAYDEALNLIFEEGLENRINRHRKCADAFYEGLGAMGLTPYAKPDARSNVVIAVNYLEGIDDKKFRDLLSNEFKVLVAGGFGNLKGKVFRIGSMGEVNKYHVVRTLSAIESAFQMMGVDVPSGSINKAITRL
ncbi:pyridoxal-phosphate-dependent aminotransferase family protein [Candidatus Nitrosocosmicus hydrocola]|uniref:pyridoxal-phosphate-dependent aminotransferase family protein n=1 Tax=Candidatus Nitrosocosmicus hydrocola TaxID=1826872 RepID=UPI000B13C0B4|nr:alanine--glyoxylate aminotransferase family protein [Candidatus Nitrosocosmicus hydrocola]